MERAMAMNNCNKILIITGGSIDYDFLQSIILKEEYSMKITADRGLLAADKLKLSPDYILGDFDSVPLDILSKYKNKSTPIKTFPVMKDKTDTEIALEVALLYRPARIDILGATGSRLDHFMANMNLLVTALDKGISVRIIDPNNMIYLKKDSFVIRKEEQYGDYISLLPFSDKITGLSLKGFKYPLDKITMTKGSSLGISNEIVEEEGIVEFDEGIMLVFETKD